MSIYPRKKVKEIEGSHTNICNCTSTFSVAIYHVLPINSTTTPKLDSATMLAIFSFAIHLKEC